MGITNKDFFKRKNIKRLKSSLTIKSKKINKKRLKKTRKYKEKQLERREITNYKEKRRKARRRIFKKYDFNNKDTIPVVIGKSLGIEFGDIDSFVEVGKKIVDSNVNDIKIHLQKCEKLWPSALMLICSFHQWRNLAYKYNRKIHKKTCCKPSLGSYAPKNKELQDYLIQSGFYDYVHVDHYTPTDINPDEIVKVKLNNTKEVIEARMEELEDLITKKANLTPELKEELNCYVIPEIINNATEHGENCFDQGWWTLGQYFPETHIISICIADNGIGFKETLCTGPQSQDTVITELNEKDAKETDYIELAFKDGISGAMDAKHWELNIFHEHLPAGSNRGGGLSGIKEKCKKCGIKLSIFSQYGYIIYGENGKILDAQSFDRRIFGGTFFNLVIPGI